MKSPVIAIVAGLSLMASVTTQAAALKIGVLVSLSGPMAPIAKHVRDGFLLAVKQHDGQLGGLETKVIVQDDALKPELAVTYVQQFLQRDAVDFVVGGIASNILQAIHHPVTGSETFLIGVNAGTSMFAGQACNPFFFSTSWENNQIPEAMGKYAQENGHKRVVTLVPNYQGGRDAVAGFKHLFKGEILDELYVPIGHLDFAAELAQIRALEPDAVLVFMPGSMGIALMRQYAQARLSGAIPFLSVWTVDEITLPAIRDAAVGFYSASQWTPDLDNEANAAFVDAFLAEYGYLPSAFAVQGYDAAMLIDSAVTALDGDLSDKDRLRAALEAVDFTSPRGDFRYNTNHFPIQDFYLVQAVRRADDRYATSVRQKIFAGYADRQASKCPM